MNIRPYIISKLKWLSQNFKCTYHNSREFKVETKWVWFAAHCEGGPNRRVAQQRHSARVSTQSRTWARWGRLWTLTQPDWRPPKGSGDHPRPCLNDGGWSAQGWVLWNLPTRTSPRSKAWEDRAIPGNLAAQAEHRGLAALQEQQPRRAESTCSKLSRPANRQENSPQWGPTNPKARDVRIGREG